MLNLRLQLQVQNGIDAVIVDSVLAIRKGLTDVAAEAEELAAAAHEAVEVAESEASRGENGSTADDALVEDVAEDAGAVDNGAASGLAIQVSS